MPSVQTQKQLARSPGRRWRGAVIGLTIAVFAVCVAGLERKQILSQIGAWWVVSDEPVKADAVVVLGGDFDVRPFAAAELYKHGLSGTILISNVRMGKAERLGFIPSHTELNRDVLLKLNVPITAIVTFGKDLSSTEQEASALREWALQSQAKRILVPTALFATRRTRWILNRELAPIGVQIVVSAYPADQYTLTDWWHHSNGLVDFNNEVLKYLYYRAQYSLRDWISMVRLGALPVDRPMVCCLTLTGDPHRALTSISHG